MCIASTYQDPGCILYYYFEDVITGGNWVKNKWDLSIISYN